MASSIRTEAIFMICQANRHFLNQVSLINRILNPTHQCGFKSEQETIFTEGALNIPPIKKAPDLSEAFRWYQLESNQRHKDFQSFALPTELWYQTIPVLFGTANVVSFLV